MQKIKLSELFQDIDTALLDDFQTTITNVTKYGDQVVIPAFGSFSTSNRSRRSEIYNDFKGKQPSSPSLASFFSASATANRLDLNDKKIQEESAKCPIK